MLVLQNLREQATSFDSEPLRGNSLQRGTADSNTLKLIKSFLPSERHQVDKLWDSEVEDYTSDQDRIAELLNTKTAAAWGWVRVGGSPLREKDITHLSSA